MSRQLIALTGGKSETVLLAPLVVWSVVAKGMFWPLGRKNVLKGKGDGGQDS